MHPPNEIPFRKEWCIVYEEDSVKNGQEKAKKLMKIAPQIDGLFSITDHTAIGAINHFKNIGLKVLENISVIRFSNWKISALTPP